MKPIRPIPPILPIVLLASAICLTSCRSLRTVEQIPVHVHDTLRLTQTLRDSTFIDRWHTVYTQGDTIYVTDQVTKTVTKIITDTAYRYIERPVVVSKMETVEVEKPLAWWQKGLMYAGATGLFVAALAIVLRLRKH